MKRIAQFEKVNYEQFKKDWKDTFLNTKITTNIKYKNIYDNILLPRQATKGSARYDFFAPVDFILRPRETIKIPTGICVQILDGWVLKCYPRSGLGFNYRLQLDNTVGIIDSDYYFSENNK